MNTPRYLLIVLLILTCLYSGCAINKDNIRGFNLISVQEETQLGCRIAVEVEKQRMIVTDPQVQGYITRLGNQLLRGVRKREFNFTFKVVRDDSVNAFAIPGGHIYVNSGLIKFVKTEKELAAVMAHEINHCVARHGTQKITQQYGYSLVLQLLQGRNPSLLTQLASSLFKAGAFLSYSREMENQADYLAVETTYRAGYDPRGMVIFLQKLELREQSKSGNIGQFFSSHPVTRERIRQVQFEILKLPRKAFRDDSTGLNRIKSRI